MCKHTHTGMFPRLALPPSIVEHESHPPSVFRGTAPKVYREDALLKPMNQHEYTQTSRLLLKEAGYAGMKGRKMWV